MKPHRVDSNEHLLSEPDIILVAAHSFPRMAREIYERSGKPEGVSAERVLHAVMTKLYEDPQQIRLRHGNTVFLVRPLTEDAGLVSMLDADTPENLETNMVVTAAALQKMGYRTLVLGVMHKEAGNRRIVHMAKALAKKRGWEVNMHNSAAVVRMA